MHMMRFILTYSVKYYFKLRNTFHFASSFQYLFLHYLLLLTKIYYSIASICYLPISCIAYSYYFSFGHLFSFPFLIFFLIFYFHIHKKSLPSRQTKAFFYFLFSVLASFSISLRKDSRYKAIASPI